MVNFPSQTNIKKTKRNSIGKRDSSKERRRSSLTNTVIVRRTPSGNRIENNQNVEEVIQKITDNKPPASQASTSSSISSRESRSNSTKTTASSKPKRTSLAGKPPQSPSSKLQMARRRSMGKTTKTMTVSKNQSVSPKQRKSPKDKKKDKKKNKSGEEKKLVLGENNIDYSQIPVSEVSELKLASFTTTETETTTTEATVTSNGLKNDVSEVILQPVVQEDETNKYTDNTILIDDDMLGMMIGALGDRMRKYIPNLRAHKVTVDQLMHAEFDSNDYLKMGIDENDVQNAKNILKHI